MIWLFNAYHHWAWERTQAALIEQGVPMTFEEVLPPEIPDADNFAAQPLFQELADNPEKARLKRVSLYNWQRIPLNTETVVGSPFGGWSSFRPHDLKEQAKHYREHAKAYDLNPFELKALRDEEVVLKALTFHQEILTEVESYLDRPGARFDAVFKRPLVFISPHPADELKDLIRIQIVQAQAYLRLERIPDALERLLKALRLHEIMIKIPRNIAQAAGSETLRGILTVIWEGWVTSAWDQGQLRELESALTKMDYLSTWLSTIRLESLALLEKEPSRFMKELLEHKGALDSAGPAKRALLDLVLPGLWDRNRIHYSQDFNRLVSEIYDKETGAMHLSASDFTFPPSILGKYIPDRALSTTCLVAVELPAELNAIAQASVALARTALRCAIYQKQEGHWPVNLTPILSGEDGPFGIDPFSGDWVRYLPPASDDPADLPTLYSISINGVDDGGVALMKRRKSGTLIHVKDQGDLVWAARLKYRTQETGEEILQMDFPQETIPAP